MYSAIFAAALALWLDHIFPRPTLTGSASAWRLIGVSMYSARVLIVSDQFFSTVYCLHFPRLPPLAIVQPEEHVSRDDPSAPAQSDAAVSLRVAG